MDLPGGRTHPARPALRRTRPPPACQMTGEAGKPRQEETQEIHAPNLPWPAGAGMEPKEEFASAVKELGF